MTTKRCASKTCGNEFEIHKGRGRPRKYCSGSCWCAANPEKMKAKFVRYNEKRRKRLRIEREARGPIVCAQCGKPFERPGTVGAPPKTCSEGCRTQRCVARWKKAGKGRARR